MEHTQFITTMLRRAHVASVQLKTVLQKPKKLFTFHNEGSLGLQHLILPSAANELCRITHMIFFRHSVVV